jgi:sugar lactone lactonase YvrE
VDIVRSKLFRFDPVTSKNEAFDIRQPPGTVVERAGTQSEVVLATPAGICAYNMDTRAVTEVLAVNPEAGNPRCFGNRFNDGKCDPAGRLFAGTMDFHCADGKGALYRFDAAASIATTATTATAKFAATAVVQPATIPNGIVWTPEGDAMYWIDTLTGCVDRFDFNLESGEVSNRTTAVRIADHGEEEGFPDGMTIDAEGKLWVAMWGGWGVNRYDPITGEKLASIELPCAQVTSCAFGGDLLDQLFITPASCGLDAAALEAQPLAGGLFVADLSETGVVGMQASCFQG